MTIHWGDELTERHFNFVAGTAEYLDTILNDTPVAPDQTSLDQNFPNPFQRSTRIGYQLQRRDNVSLTIYNLLGQEIQTLVQSTQNPGQYEVVWDGLDNAGQQVSSGMYIYRLKSGSFSASGKMALVR